MSALRRKSADWTLRIVALLSSTSVVCLPIQAVAAAKDAGKEVADQAAAKFKEGKFIDAGELFERAFALNPKMMSVEYR